MYQLTTRQYNSIHKDYRSVWTNQDYPQYIGKRTAFENSLQGAMGLQVIDKGCCLIIEGSHFEIKD